MKLTRRDFAVTIAAGIAAPNIIRSARAQGATIKLGMCVPVTGPAAEQGLWAQNGAKLALAAVNKAGGVLGKQVELVIEDDQTTNPGIVLAFSKLAAQDDIVGFLGSIRSTQVHAMAPDVLKVGKKLSIEAGEEIDIKTGDAKITMKKDGSITIEGKDITLKGSGKISVKADSDVTIKGSKVGVN